MLPPMVWLNICMSCATRPMCLCVLCEVQRANVFAVEQNRARS